MADLALARLLHVVAIVLWIGGVAMVTMMVLPAARAARDPEQFLLVERLFAAQTRWTLLLAGASGLYMVERMGLWPRFAARAARDPDGALQRMYRHHLVVLALSLVTVAGAVAGAHGLL